MLNKPHPLSIANKAPVTPITGNIKLTIIVFVRLTEKFANHLLVFGCWSLRSGLTISKMVSPTSIIKKKPKRKDNSKTESSSTK